MSSGRKAKKSPSKQRKNKNPGVRRSIRSQAKKDIEELYQNNKLKMFFWTTVIVFAMLFLVIRLGVLNTPYVFPSEFGNMDRIITAFIIIAFLQLSLAIMHPVYTTYAGKKIFRSYAAAKQSWRLITYIVWISTSIGLIAYLVGFQNLALSLGLISAAFVYVMQTPIMNAMGWLYLSYAKIYRIGDRIQIDEMRGDVVDITLMHTNIREIDGWLNGDILTGRIISIPNKRIFEGGTTNYTAQSPYIWDSVKVSITYESDQRKAREIIEEEMKKVAGDEMKHLPKEIKRMADFPELADRFVTEPKVFMQLAPSSIIMEGVYACHSEMRSQIHSKIIENMLHRISLEDDVNIAYPHIHIIEDRGEERR